MKRILANQQQIKKHTKHEQQEQNSALSAIAFIFFSCLYYFMVCHVRCFLLERIISQAYMRIIETGQVTFQGNRTINSLRQRKACRRPRLQNLLQLLSLKLRVVQCQAHRKTHLETLEIREIHTKSILRFYGTLVRMSIVKNTNKEGQ